MKKIVYTCLIGNYDKLNVPGYIPPDWEAHCISDRVHITAGWKHSILDTKYRLPCDTRTARQVKVLSHIFFPDADVTLYIDANVQVLCDINNLLAFVTNDGKDIGTYKHDIRRCLYMEAQAIKRLKKDSPELVDAQVLRYRKENYPANNGLICSGVLLRKHTDAVKQLNEAWWQELCNGSRRDQLSFPYVAWKLGIKWTNIDTNIYRSQNFNVGQHIRQNRYTQTRSTWKK